MRSDQDSQANKIEWDSGYEGFSYVIYYVGGFAPVLKLFFYPIHNTFTIYKANDKERYGKEEKQKLSEWESEPKKKPENIAQHRAKKKKLRLLVF